MSAPRLTVVLLNFNHARFLGQSLEAILAQTRPAEELIVIDDASTDNSVEAITPFLAQHPNVRLVQNRKNQGVNANMNHGCAMAQSEVVFFAAADDFIFPGFFESGMSLLTAHPEAALFSAVSDTIDVNGKSLGSLPNVAPISKPGFIPPPQVAGMLLRNYSWFMGNVTLFRRSALVEVGGFPADLGSYADGFVSCLIALKHGACFTPDVLGVWRRLGVSYSHSQIVDMDQYSAIISAAKRRMDETSAFPRGYASRWMGRQLFVMRRVALVQARYRACQQGPMIYAAALLKEVVLTAWLLVRLRRQDIGTILLSRVRHLV